MARLQDQRDTFPHIAIRQANGNPEPYVPGTGLAVWEVVWLCRAYEDDMDALIVHFRGLPLTRQLAEEAIAYATAYPEQVDEAIRVMDEASEDRLRAILPSMTFLDVDVGLDDQRAR